MVSSPDVAPDRVSWTRDLMLLALLFAALFGFRLGSYPLGNPDEGRYAEIPREMLATGDWVTPRLDGVNYFEKPPLVYWVTAASERVFGLNEWAVRAVPALFALAGVLLTYAAGRALYGRAAGVAAGVALGTSLLFFALGRIILLDMAVSVLMSAALFCFVLAMRAPPGGRRRWLMYGVYASMALATLTKGLMGFLVTGAVMFLWLLVFNQWKRLRPLHLPTGALVFLAIAVPWHVLAHLHNPTWAQRYFVYEHWERFMSPVASRPGPVWYFVPIIFFGLFPWTGFVWSGAREALRGGWAARKANVDAWFLVTWAAFIFLFFTKSHSKLVPYILPIFPALAVLAGVGVTAAWRAGAGRLSAGVRTFSFVAGLLAVALVVVVLKPGIIRDPAQAQVLRPFAITMAAVLMLGGVLAPWRAKTRGGRSAVATIAVTMVFFLGVLTYAAPHIQRPGTKELALQVRAEAKPGDRVLHYHEFFHDFTFYARQTVGLVAFKGELELEEDPAARDSGRFIDDAEFHRAWAGPARLWVVARKKDLGPLLAEPAFRYHLLGETRDHYLFSNQP
ncbi:glycosyltransferase family 39 protein [Horticoccus luteus]|uniref:Glycosyltransferase family 39 protein n=1 Tax=Horticoccus luteus TaxID=2862869 RepID=A0A8F9TTV6_9BACT|nr:glycosyltransferase family 39 protein [Horticoccus luteus]QYM78945.1 glycosyltransferase family 39 protein [Horticoccus luteus]